METKQHDQIVSALNKAYNMELETVINYLANSVHLDGVRAEQIRKSLETEIQDEMGHAQQLAHRLKVLDAEIPGSIALKMEQKSLQPPQDSTDVISVIKGVIQAEEDAIAHYTDIIKMCEGVDYVTQDLIINLLGDEEEHRRLFRGYLTEYERVKH